MAKSKKHQRAKAKKEAKSDGRLIRLCVEYAQYVGAWRGGFKADPDGDSRYAADETYSARASKALAEIARLPGTTAEGLRAKASALTIAIGDDYADSMLPDVVINLALRFSAEVKTFLDPTIEEAWRASLNPACASIERQAVQS